MKPVINGPDKKWRLPGAVLALTFAGVAWAQPKAKAPQPPKAAEVTAQVAQRAQQISKGDAEYGKELLYRLQENYGVTVSCGDEIFSSQAKNLDCVQGLQNLEIALAKLDPDSKRLVREVEIKVGDSGDWGGLTYSDQELEVPFHATPEVMSAFIAKEVKLLNNVSLDDVRRNNRQMEKYIFSRYYVRVSPDSNLQPIVYHDGLERLNFALSEMYQKDSPSPEEAAKLGFDRVILGTKDKNMYENDGELRVKLDATEEWVEMQVRLMSQIRNPRLHWYQHLKIGFGPNTISGTSYTWEDVMQFRAERHSASEALQWLQENVPTMQVSCNLDRHQRYSVDMKKCARGLNTIQRAFVQYKLAAHQAPFRNMIVGHMWIGSTLAQRYRDAMIVDASASSKTIENVITQRK